jgi:hypothetical protein
MSIRLQNLHHCIKHPAVVDGESGQPWGQKAEYATKKNSSKQDQCPDFILAGF